MTIKTSFNHLQLYCSNKDISFAFYKQLLVYLGYKIVEEDKDHIGMRNKPTDIWIKESPLKKNKFNRRNVGVNHLAFGVSKKEDVDKFCKEFLIPNKIKPLYDSPRAFPEYTKNYYAVYFEDPDGLKLEIVFL
jgi:catechol 2,3-dioxygenase-like lactoylglutathione lyase family enzyme